MNYSNTWQLIITSISSVVTFLMVFLIQYAQNKDTKAMQIKLDELIKTNRYASNKIIDIEEESEEVIETEKKKLKRGK